MSPEAYMHNAMKNIFIEIRWATSSLQWHGHAAGSVATSHLQDTQFDPELRLLSVC